MTSPAPRPQGRATAWWIVAVCGGILVGALTSGILVGIAQQQRVDPLEAAIVDQENKISDIGTQLDRCQGAISDAAAAIGPAYDKLDGISDSLNGFFNTWDFRAGDPIALSAGILDNRAAVSGALNDAVESLSLCDMTAP